MLESAKLCLLLMAFTPLLTDAKLGPLREVFGWKTLDFDFQDEAARQNALSSGSFIPGNCLPIDVQPVHDRVFITTPMLKDGIPATLSTVPSSPKQCVHGKRCAPLLRPFPDWSWNNGDRSCSGLTSVFRVNVDQCGRLWVIDSGTVNIFTANSYRFCPPQLLSFDLRNDRLIRRYIFPNDILKSDSLLITVALNTLSKENNCAKTYAYSADVTTYALIVTDTNRGNSWRVKNKLFFPYPKWGTFHVAGQKFDLMDGIFSLAVHPDRKPEKRNLYYHSLASAVESHVSTELLRNASQANLMTEEFFSSRGEKPSQSAASAFDRRGILYFGLLGENSLACWNPSKPHVPSNIVQIAHDDVALQFASGVKVCKILRYQIFKSIVYLITLIFFTFLPCKSKVACDWEFNNTNFPN